MTPERWARVREVLDASLALKPESRPSFLEEACGGDQDLQREIESLIASLEDAGDLLDKPALATSATVLAETLDSMVIGRHIGPYRITEEIGRGGMGSVYRAVRDDEHYRKEVAIKLVRRAGDSDFIVRRFRHERQIMAGLDHPNIAGLLDGGSTEDGLPYFVMEYIHGQPIDEYCDSHRLTTAERLELFRKVCGAVQYAHDHGVIHRDIKPGNILITHDGVPKLLDFGIAKILDPELSAPTAGPGVTVLRLMTPEYASPEQVRGEPIMAASDVYSLGVLLYELLTGHRPYRVKSRAPHELAQAICDIEPEKPSAVVTRSEEITRFDGSHTVRLTPQDVSEARRTRPDKLRRTLSGDLDNIVLTAMRKEPERRYPSVDALAEDIGRHLQGLPITARRDTLVYRTVKLLERNRAAVISACVAGGLFLAGSLVFRHATETVEFGVPDLLPFTSLVGDESQPLFSPDGKGIAFVWNGQDESNQDIYIRPLEGGELVRVTTDRAQDNSPTWSRDGRRIAWLRVKNDPVRTETGVFVAWLDGREVHRKVADVYPVRLDAAGIEANGRPLDWSPDGKYIAVGDKNSPEQPFSIVLISVDTGEKRRITLPPDRTIGDSNPAFSPDGKHLCFIRAPSSGVTDLYVMALDGSETRRLTFDSRDIVSAAWTPDGQSIVFSSNRSLGYALWRVPLSGGTPTRLPGIGAGASDPSFSRDGRRMAFAQFFLDTNIWRVRMREPGVPAGAPRKLIISTQYDSSAQFSPDGTRVAFRSSRSGSHEIWIADSEGLHATRLTYFGGPLTGTPRWSPDGRWVAFDSRPEGQADIFIANPDGGVEPIRITHERSEDVVPSWSRDSKWIYFASNRSGAWQVWKAPAAGGPAEKVTQQGGFASFESHDGKYLYYAKGRTVGGLWRLPLKARGVEEPFMDRLKPGFWGYWGLSRDGVYFVDETGLPGQYSIFFQPFQRGRPVEVSALGRRPMIGDSAFAVAPDDGSVLYTQVDQSGSDIIIADYDSRR
jgi:Tol biopolymer transport system component/serine/threonine protein kinase